MGGRREGRGRSCGCSDDHQDGRLHPSSDQDDPRRGDMTEVGIFGIEAGTSGASTSDWLLATNLTICAFVPEFVPQATIVTDLDLEAELRSWRQVAVDAFWLVESELETGDCRGQPGSQSGRNFSTEAHSHS